MELNTTTNKTNVTIIQYGLHMFYLKQKKKWSNFAVLLITYSISISAVFLYSGTSIIHQARNLSSLTDNQNDG